MLKISPDDFTITLPLGTCDDHTISLIKHYIDNFDNKILVIYREKEPKDYIIHPRVRYIKNIVEKHYSKVFNQCILESETEYIFHNTWRVKTNYSHLEFGIKKLEEGYGFVDINPILVCSLFSKHLISKIGFFDEWYVHSHEVDWDFLCTMRHYDIAIYQKKITDLVAWRTMQGGTNSSGSYTNFQKFHIKWKNTENGYIRLFQEKNYKDKFLLQNKYEDREYLKFEKSFIEMKYACERCNLLKSGISLDNFYENYNEEEKKFVNLPKSNFEYK